MHPYMVYTYIYLYSVYLHGIVKKKFIHMESEQDTHAVEVWPKSECLCFPCKVYHLYVWHTPTLTSRMCYRKTAPC